MKNLELISNYHTHTYRCGHAGGEDEEYVQAAINSGIKNLGFSDHVFLPKFSQPGTRGEYHMLDGYVASIFNLKEKYKDKINLYTGFEAEGLPMYFEYYNDLLSRGKIDYLILGNHLSLTKELRVHNSYFKCETREKIDEYVHSSIKSLETGLFSIFAHPDLFMGFIPEFDYYIENKCIQLIKCAISLDIPLEVNMGGLRQGLFQIGDQVRIKYPTDFFFNIAGKMGAKCIVGVDAHYPKDLLDSNYFDYIADFIKRHKLNVINQVTFKKR